MINEFGFEMIVSECTSTQRAWYMKYHRVVIASALGLEDEHSELAVLKSMGVVEGA